MDLEAELQVLQAENLALQAVLIALCRRLAARPELADAVCGSFEDAEDMMSATTLRIGGGAPIGNTVGALRLIEEIRAAAIKDEGICRTGG